MSLTPAVTILPEYTDEALRTQGFFGEHVAATLLTVPAEYRQPVEAEVTARTTTHSIEWRDGNAISVLNRVGDPHEARLEIIAEVLAQLAVPDAG